MAKSNSKFQHLDDKFEHFLDGVLLEFVETDFTEEKKAERRKRADADDLEFCKIYFPNIFTLQWNELHLRTANLKPGKYTRSGFRKCGKSAFVYTACAIKPLAQGIGGIIAINCQTLDISEERTAALKRLMFRNQLLCYDYELDLQQDLKGCYIINNTYMIAGSVGKGLRSYVDDEFKRIRRAINDDLYDKTNVVSKAHTERVVDFVEYEVAGQLEDDGISITLGNATAETAPIVTLRERRPENHFGLPALDEAGKSTWQDYKTEVQWKQFFEDEKIPWDVIQGDYLDKPAVRGDRLDPDWLRPVNINLIEIIASISAVDPSFGDSPAACFKSIATVGVTKAQEVIVQDIYLRKEGYPMFFDYLDALRRRIPAWKVCLFEDDFSQWKIAHPYYLDWMKKRKKTLPIMTHYASQLKTEHRGADKETRLLNLIHPHQTGMILYSDAIMKTPDFERFRSQYLAFGRAKEKLDGLDALATAYIMIFRYITTGSFKPAKQRTFGRVQTWFRKA